MPRPPRQTFGRARIRDASSCPTHAGRDARTSRLRRLPRTPRSSPWRRAMRDPPLCAPGLSFPVRSRLDSDRPRPDSLRRDLRPGMPACRLVVRKEIVQPTDISEPNYFHKVVDCQWACPAHTPVPEYIRLIAAGRHADAYMVNWESNV